MAAELLAPDELPDLIESDDYKALPFDQRQKVLTGALGEAHQWQAQNGGWTADSWKQFGELASVARRRVTESETFGEKAKSVAGTIGGVVKDSAVAGSLMTLGTMNTVTASVFPVGRNFAANMGRAKQAGMESLRQSAGPETNWLEGDLKGLKKDIDEGNIPFGDQAKLDEWLKGHDETLARDATAYQIKVGKRTPEEAAQWSRDNGLLGNPQNAGLLASYMQTRDPAALDALRDNLLTTKGRAEANAAQVKMNKASIGGKALDALGVGSEMLAEAGDPLEVAGTVLPVLKGAKLVQKGVSAGRKIGAAAAATAGEVASELGSQFIDNPNATWEQRAQVAKETLYGTLGLAGIGAAAGKVLQSRQTPVSEQSPAAAISSPPPIPGAPSPAAQPTTNNQAPGTLSSIAQRGGTVDVPSAMPDLQEHTGDLTAADVADLEAAAAPPPLFPSSSPPSPASVTPEASPVPIPEAPASAPVAPVADAGSTPAAGTTPSPETALTRATTDRMASDTGAAQNNEPSPGGLSEAEVARMALFDQVRADAASKIRDGEVTRTAYGENWENMKSSAPLFDHFTLPAGWKMKEDWFGTNGGSWYATIEDAGGREYKISVRDHEPTRKDMGIPDYFREVSKEWHPEEVDAALSGLEQRLQRRADYQSRLRSDAGFREAEAHKQARRELDRFEQLIQENEKKADDLDARGKTEKAANARIQAQQMREGSTYKSLIATLNKANAEPLAESGAASHIITGDRTNGSFGIKPKPEGAAAPTRAEGVRMANRASEATSDSEEISPQTPPSVNPESTGAADRTSLFRNLDPSGTTAGYLNTDIINEAVDLIARGFRDFASWSKAMLTRFGQRIGDYLQGVWQAAMKTSQQGFIGIGKGNTSVQKLNPFQRGKSFRVQNPNVRTLLTGSALPTELRKLVTATEHEVTAMNDAAAAVGRDLDRAMQAHAAQTGQTEQAINDRVNAALEGGLPLNLVGNAQLQEAVRRTRNMLDDLSTVVGNQTGGNLGQTILSNLGTWMRRSYAAFDPDANWTYDALTAAAAKGAQVAGVPAAKILRDARDFLKRQNPQASDAEITADMRSLMDRAVWEDVMTGGAPSGVRKDVTSLMRRKVIPAELRALMGEERNPVKRFLGSTRFQSQYIARHEMQQRMRDMGLKSGLFSTTRENEYTEAIGESGDRGKSGFALNGQPIYTTPELKKALAFAPGAIAPTDVGSAALKVLYYIGGQAKLNKVALNPDSWAVNLLGNLTGLVQTGGMIGFSTWSRGRKAVELMRSGKAQAVTAGQAALRDHLRAMMARLTAAGVADSSLNAALVEDGLNSRLIQFIDQTDAGNIGAGVVKGAVIGQSLGAAFGVTGRAVGGALGGIAGGVAGNKRVNAVQHGIAKWMLQNPDRLGKIVEFLDNYEVGLKAGLKDQQAFDLARDKTLDTMPDYSKLPSLLRGGSRLGVFGSFIAFQYEVYRNAFHNARYAAQELRSGSPALMAKGARRLMGQSAVMALAAGGLQAMIGKDSGDEDEKDRAYRRALARPWERYSKLAYTVLDKERASFYNTSYLLPQVTMMELWQAGAAGADFESSLENIAEVFNRQFLDTGIHIDPLLSALTNRTKDGRKVSNEEGMANYIERLATAMAPMVPGAAEKLERMMRSKEVMNRPRWDREFSMEEEGKRMLGVRQSTYSHERRMSGRIREFHEKKREISDALKSVYGETGGTKTDQWGREKQQTAVARANERLGKLKAEWEQFEKDISTLGIPDSTLRAVQRESGGRMNWNEMKIGPDGPGQVRLR